MKKIVLLAAVFVLIFTSFVFAKHFWRGSTLSVSKVEKKWGKEPLNLEKFKAGDEKLRAAMAASILKDQKKFYGKTIDEIRTSFGQTSGFYFVDIYPTYIIQTATKQGEETWQIVFLIDNDRKVNEVIVHKNCCD